MSASVSLLLAPRVMKLQERWDATERLLENIALMMECRPIWARMHRDSSVETPLYNLICAAEKQKVLLKMEQVDAVAEMLRILPRE